MASEQDLQDSGATWSWAVIEPEPTGPERDMLDMFAREYLVDYDAAKAASRCGFMAPFNQEYGKQFIQRSYVQKKLRELQEHVPDPKAEAVYNKRLVMSTLREVATDRLAPPAARVAAAARLAEIHGMSVAANANKPASGTRGGVMYVPGIAKVDDWEKAAMASQKALAEASRVE